MIGGKAKQTDVLYIIGDARNQDDGHPDPGKPRATEARQYATSRQVRPASGTAPIRRAAGPAVDCAHTRAAVVCLVALTPSLSP